MDVDETPPEGLPVHEVAEYLARLKADAWQGTLEADHVLVTADTTVLLDDLLLNKPVDRADAERMLALLAGRTHRVITGVCLRTATRTLAFSDITLVTFGPLLPAQITYYVEHYSPLDKAGAYGVQDWIGYVAVQRIEGSFYNVMGLPLHRVHAGLLELTRDR